MTDALAPVRWIIGGRRLKARSILRPDLVTTVWRFHANIPFETRARDRVYARSGWASAKAGAVKIVRKGLLPFTPVLNVKFQAHGQGASLVFSEGLLLNSWFLLLIYGAAATLVLATSGGRLDQGVISGLLFGVGFFLVNRWIARKDIEVLLDSMMSEIAALAVDEWPLEQVQASIVEPGGTFGRRR